MNQTYSQLEIILVDDGSPDGCPAICDRAAEKDLRIRVIHQKNAGQSAARNLALDLCRGDYVTFVDSDDFLEKDAYENMVSLAEKTGAKLVCCGRYNVKEDTGEKKIGLCPCKEEVLSAPEMLKRMFTWQGCDCSPCDKIFRREVFRGIRFPLETYCEDIAILYRLVIAAGTCALLPKPFYNYLQRRGSTSYGQVSPRMFRFEDQTKPVYDYILKNLPEVKKEARYLRVRSLYVTVVLLDQADGAQRKCYRDRLKRSRRELRSHFFFIASSPYFSRQERMTDLLMAMNLYRFTRRIFHRG